MFIGREGEIAAADPSSREQQQQYAFNKNKYSIWLCVYRGMKPATIIITIIIILLWMLFYNSLLILILIIGASSLFLLSCRTQEHYLEVELFGLAAMDLSTDGVVLSIHRTELRRYELVDPYDLEVIIV